MSESNYLDLTELAKDLFAAAENIERSTQDLLEAAADQIVADAKSRVRVKTGRLQNSITKQSTKLKVIVGPAAPYGAFIEYGTGTRGEFPGGMYEILPKNGQYLKFKVGGRTVFARSVKHPGIRPYPFMRPAAKQWVEDLPRDMARVGVELITGHNPQAAS